MRSIPLIRILRIFVTWYAALVTKFITFEQKSGRLLVPWFYPLIS